MAGKFIGRLRQEIFDWRFIKFILVGGFNTFSCTFFAWLCLDLVHDANISFVIGYFASNFLAYLINGIWIFREALSWTGYGKFALSYVPNFLCENLVVGLLLQSPGIPACAQLPAGGGAGCAHYLFAGEVFCFWGRA